MIYRYSFQVDHVHDGDTIYGDLDMGLGVHLAYVGLRFYSINAPELSTPEGKLCRDYLNMLVKPDDILTVDSYHWDKYAMRIDAVPFLDNLSLVEAMSGFIANGYKE